MNNKFTDIDFNDPKVQKAWEVFYQMQQPMIIQMHQQIMAYQQQMQLYNDYVEYIKKTNPMNQLTFIQFCEMRNNNNNQANFRGNVNFQQPMNNNNQNEIINSMNNNNYNIQPQNQKKEILPRNIKTYYVNPNNNNNQGNLQENINNQQSIPFKMMNPLSNIKHNENEIYHADPNQPNLKQILPRNIKSIYVNQNDLNQKPDTNTNSDIITLRFYVTPGEKYISVLVHRMITFEQLIQKFSEESKISYDRIQKSSFLFNGKKLDIKSQEPIKSLFNNFNNCITAIIHE